MYKYEVKHPDHGEIEVTAEDGIQAAKKAAKAWKVGRWTSIAWQLDIKTIGEAKKGGRTVEKDSGD